jgi:hypothetical protein
MIAQTRTHVRTHAHTQARYIKLLIYILLRHLKPLQLMYYKRAVINALISYKGQISDLTEN